MSCSPGEADLLADRANDRAAAMKTTRKRSRVGILVCLAVWLPACSRHDAGGGPSEPLRNTIRWSTASESNNFGFDVYRGDSAEGPFRRLTAEPIQGGLESDTQRDYEFVDDTIEEGKTYYYYVESISLDNVREPFTPVEASKPKYRQP
jgi:hypothetical protein